MDLKAVLARTRNVSGLYGDDLVIVKPDCPPLSGTPWPVIAQRR